MVAVVVRPDETPVMVTRPLPLTETVPTVAVPDQL